MSLYRFSATIVKRSEGKSAIGRAAYISLGELIDELTGKTWDYSRKLGLEFQGIFAPAWAPEWVKDRQRLWNEVERAEDRLANKPDKAQLARDFKISLPWELNKQQREWLVKDFARSLMRQGMIIDVAIHAPDAHSNEKNYHVHMLATMREIKEDGFGWKQRKWNRNDQLVEWKERWAIMGAKALERAALQPGADRANLELEAKRFRYGHLTLPEQRKKALERGDLEHADACNRKPTRPLGPAAAAMERDGKRTVTGDKNRDIKRENELTQKVIRKARRGRDVGRGLREKGEEASGIAAKGVERITEALTSILDPKLTPKQKVAAKLAHEEREIDAGRGRER